MFSVRHNKSAVGSANSLTANVSGLKKTSQKLSSGYQINRAGDNASGLAVSEKLRSQIRGLSQAIHNTNDGISLAQTAEGGLGEIHSILHRMRELSVQASNGVYTDSDREAIQLEVDSLKSEVNRIAASTEFNNKKILNGEGDISVNVNDRIANEFGATYGSVNENLAIGGGKIKVTSNVRDVYLQFTTGASGKGGENAVWYYDIDRTNGDLTQHVLINLAEGGVYTDADIQKLIDNATVPKNFDAPISNVTFSSEVGVIHAAEATTYGLRMGTTRQEMEVGNDSLTLHSTVRYEMWSPTRSKNFPIRWDNHTACSDVPDPTPDDPNHTTHVTDTSQKPIVVDSNGTIHLNHNCSYSGEDIKDALLNSGFNFFENNNVTHENIPVDEDGMMDDIAVSVSDITEDMRWLSVTYKEKYEQPINEYYEWYTFDLEANQYGSYADYIEDLEKYKQPDCAGVYNMKALSGVELRVSPSATENISCATDGDKLVVTIKEGYETTSSSPITSKIQQFLYSNGYNYSVTAKTNYTGQSTSDKKNDQIGKFVAQAGTADGKMITEGHRFIKRVGTVAGVRQNHEGDLSALVNGGATNILGSSDRISFTANTYGASKDYDTIAGSITISVDCGEGEESTEINGKNAVLHLAIGVKYSEGRIESMLKEAGLDYTVTLTDVQNPDGDKDGYMYFINEGVVNTRIDPAGEGIGISDIADLSDKVELQIGANGSEDQRVAMKIEDAGSESIGIDTIDVSTADKANKAVSAIDGAIYRISLHRAAIGALQNRLEHTAENLTQTDENLTDAESGIRDTDMASEMVEHTKYSVLQQASQAILAQANQMPQSVLQLLG